MNHNRYLRFASSSPCTSLCLAMTQRWFENSFVSVGVKPCETGAKQKGKKHQRCSWQLPVFRRKKTITKQTLKKGTIPIKTRLASKSSPEAVLVFGLHDVHMVFGCFLVVRNVSS